MCADCQRLHEQLQENHHEMYVLRRTVSNLQMELKGERRKVEHFRKKNDKQHIRKGQKRGARGFNG